MKIKRKELSDRQQQWLSHLRRAQARKLSLAQYCRAQGLSVQTLYNVRHELAQKGLRPASSTGRAGTDGGVLISLAPFAWLLASLIRGTADLPL